jgi:hypothetical protein
VTPDDTGDVEEKEINLTLTFDDKGTVQGDDPPTSKSVKIMVVPMKMVFKSDGVETHNIVRAKVGTFEVVDGKGNPPTDATYSKWFFSGKTIYVSGENHAERMWSGPIVDSGWAQCDVKTKGRSRSVNRYIIVDPRIGNDWKISPTFKPDTNANFGDFPGIVRLGQNRALQQVKDIDKIIWPRDNAFLDGVELYQISSGANKGVIYVKRSSYTIDRVSWINKFIKGHGIKPPANGPVEGWWEHNLSQNVDVNLFLEAVLGHEACGLKDNKSGHQQFLKDAESKKGCDARTEVEEVIAKTQMEMENTIFSTVGGIDEHLNFECGIEPTNNWDGIYEYWDFTRKSWIPIKTKF